MNRPRSLEELALWALTQGAEAVLEPPTQLHVKHMPKGADPGHGIHGVIRGKPFAPAFLRYLDNQKPKTPIRRALAKMRTPGKKSPQSLEYRICFGLVESGHDLESMRVILRCSEQYLRASAARGLDVLWNLTQLELAGEKAA